MSLVGGVSIAMHDVIVRLMQGTRTSDPGLDAVPDTCHGGAVEDGP